MGGGGGGLGCKEKEQPQIEKRRGGGRGRACSEKGKEGELSYLQSSFNDRIRVVISDGTNLLDGTIDTGDISDGNWHSIVLVSQDSVSDHCVACTDFSDDYQQVTTPVITLYVDKVSKGTLDHSRLTRDLSTSELTIIRAKNTSF